MHIPNAVNGGHMYVGIVTEPPHHPVAVRTKDHLFLLAGEEGMGPSIEGALSNNQSTDSLWEHHQLVCTARQQHQGMIYNFLVLEVPCDAVSAMGHGHLIMIWPSGPVSLFESVRKDEKGERRSR